MAAEDKKIGRPSAYKPEYAEQARKLCLLGHTDAELASFFDVSEQTINAWKHAHPDFLESIKRARLLRTVKSPQSYSTAPPGTNTQKMIFALSMVRSS